MHIGGWSFYWMIVDRIKEYRPIDEDRSRSRQVPDVNIMIIPEYDPNRFPLPKPYTKK